MNVKSEIETPKKRVAVKRPKTPTANDPVDEMVQIKKEKFALEKEIMEFQRKNLVLQNELITQKLFHKYNIVMQFNDLEQETED